MPELRGFIVHGVDHQRSPADQTCGLNATLKRMLHQARANAASRPFRIGGKLAEKKAGDRIRRLTSADRARQHSRDNGGRSKTVVADDTSSLVNNENGRETLLLIGQSACLQPVIKRRVSTGELRHVMRGGEWFGSR